MCILLEILVSVPFSVAVSVTLEALCVVTSDGSPSAVVTLLEAVVTLSSESETEATVVVVDVGAGAFVVVVPDFVVVVVAPDSVVVVGPDFVVVVGSDFVVVVVVFLVVVVATVVVVVVVTGGAAVEQLSDFPSSMFGQNSYFPLAIVALKNNKR